MWLNMAYVDIAIGVLSNVPLMLSQSVDTSVISGRLGALYLKEGGTLVLTGAAASVSATPGMVIQLALLAPLLMMCVRVCISYPRL
jgi:hypothetical protein